MDGTPISAEDNAAQQAQFSEVALTAAAGAQANLADGGSDVTFAQAFDIIDTSILQDENLNWFITTSMESDIGGPIESTSAAYGVSGKENSGGDYLLPNGYDQILNYIGRNVTPVLNTQVTGIDYSNADQVTVTTTSGSYIGSHVIVTVPLGVLKKGVITFTPKLPETKQQAIDTLLMGTLNKVWLKFPNNDWKGNTTFAWGLNKGISKELRGRLSWFLNTGLAITADPTALLVFAMGQAGIDIEGESDEAVIAEIMTSLRLIFGPNVPEPTGMVRSKWSSDPYTYGCYAYAGLGATSDSYATVGEPVGTNLYFAGEHTNVNYKGYVHGAYQSGLRAANELMVSLGVATAAPAETTGPPNAAFNNNHYQKPGVTARPRTTRAVRGRSSASTASAGIVLALLAVLVHFA
jgi:predicted NAD/FAD-dependent oxidoreductase